jgi:uncharacterized protein YcbK (DUF882 family)
MTTLTFRVVRWSDFRAVPAAVDFIRFGHALAVLHDAITVIMSAILLCHYRFTSLSRFFNRQSKANATKKNRKISNAGDFQLPDVSDKDLQN